MASYLFAVQDATGREVCSAVADVEKVSAVAARAGSGEASITHGEEVLASGPTEKIAGDLVFLRWPADDKLADPVVKAVEESEKGA